MNDRAAVARLPAREPTATELMAAINALRADVLAALAGRPLPEAATRDFLRAIDSVWGNGAFRCGELLAWCADPAFAGRRAVVTATRELLELRPGAPLTAHALGLRLARIAGIPADGLVLERVAATERGARLWAVVQVRG